MFQSLLAKIASLLDGAKIPYMVIGGQAVLRYGRVRLTNDIDITLGVTADALGRIKERLQRIGLELLVSDVEGFVAKTNVLPVIDPESGIRIDFVFSFSLYERQAIERSHSVRIDQQIVKYASPEDLIIHKIVAGRPVDVSDVKGILQKGDAFDKEYILRWLLSFEQALGRPFVQTFKALLSEPSAE